MVRLVAIAWVPFPPTEGSLYYLDVARNLVQGHGLTTDVLWSYANPPFTPAPTGVRPVAATGQPGRGRADAHRRDRATRWASWVASLLGACLAPLAWAVAR